MKPTALIADIDGVMTTGNVLFDPNGRCLREFSVQDGQGQAAIQELGLLTGYISSSKCNSGIARLHDLGATFVDIDVSHGPGAKLTRLQARLAEYGLKLEDCVYLGDDTADLCAIGKAGLFVAPSNSCIEITRLADIQVPFHGGDGFYRAVTEALHFSRLGKWIGG
jgi:3-deoxy-D-manno-octulosonate 8-phosphate phosphatase (KDO 8-P phosphatase)